MNIPITLFRSDTVGNKNNSCYPISAVIKNADELKEFVKYDHVAVEYKNHMRANTNFIKSDCVVMDIDNDHTENPADWIDIERLNKDLKDIEFYVVTSRNHMKEKNGKLARPKYHVYFQISLIMSAEEYAKLKERICEQFPYFDKNAKDAARFFFGNPEAEVTYHKG